MPELTCRCTAQDLAIGHLTYCVDGAVSLASHVMDPAKARVCVRQHVRDEDGNRCKGCYRGTFWPCFEARVANYAIGVRLPIGCAEQVIGVAHGVVARQLSYAGWRVP